jgi:hypothetical protein
MPCSNLLPVGRDRAVVLTRFVQSAPPFVRQPPLTVHTTLLLRRSNP